jgi:hypothetical protein
LEYRMIPPIGSRRERRRRGKDKWMESDVEFKEIPIKLRR